MKLTFLQYVTIFFVIGWVLGDVCMIDYAHKVYSAVFSAFIAFVMADEPTTLKAKLRALFVQNEFAKR